MELFNLFQFIPYIVAVGFVVVPVLFVWMLFRIYNYIETDEIGRSFRLHTIGHAHVKIFRL